MILPKVSICMPVFNGGHYFKAALESALNQDYANLEIVIVNDGSTDGGETERIALAAGDRVRYFVQPNRGVAGAMNTALAQMTGDYFAWLSHDDLHLPHKTAAQVAFLQRLGRPLACLFSDYELIGPADESIATVRLPANSIRQNPRLPLYNGLINGCTLLIPADILRQFGPFDEALRCTQDYDVWNRILEQHEFFHQPEVLIRYRIHPGQGTNTPLAASEGDRLWVAMLNSRNEIERAQMFGSARRYFTALAKFLETTPYQQAAVYARARVETVGADVLVSVVIAVHNNVPAAVRAVRSALDQTHHQVEVIVVDDGSTDDLAPLVDLAANERRLLLLHQPYLGPAAARNRALIVARGVYIAFLDSQDWFLPAKIERHYQQMQQNGALFSHTSSYITRPMHGQGLKLRDNGRFGGVCYPAIIATQPIDLSTVMLHRCVVDEGFRFETERPCCDDMLAWIDLAMRYTLLGINEPLSIVTESDEHAALNPAKRVLALSGVIEAMQCHPVHRTHQAEIEKLRASIRNLAKDWVASGRDIAAVPVSNSDTDDTSAAFPVTGNGRVSTLVRAA